MTHHAPNTLPQAPVGEPPRWTLPRMQLFIETLHRTHNVAASARTVGMSWQAAYVLRARLPGHPWVAAWDAVLAPVKRKRAVFRRMTAGYGG